MTPIKSRHFVFSALDVSESNKKSPLKAQQALPKKAQLNYMTKELKNIGTPPSKGKVLNVQGYQRMLPN